MSLEDSLFSTDGNSPDTAFFGPPDSSMRRKSEDVVPASDSVLIASGTSGITVGRVFDFLFALTVLIAVLPALLLLIVILQIDSPGPVFFVQRRVGQNGVYFSCFKLRTMVVDAAERLEALWQASPEARLEWERDHKLKNDPRTTKLGRFARKFSLDEFPQLVNILLGHMSVVGPRPIVEAEIWRYGASFADYCQVRPGLTGLWQVSGRSNTTYAERVALDCAYVRRKSLVFDLQIIARSVPVVLGARGAH